MTSQVTEVLWYKDQEYALCTEPLSLYLEKNSKIEFESPHTACWRGYIGTWAIKGTPDKGYGLYLIELLGYQNGKAELTIKDVFPDSPHGVFAHWFSGELRCPIGEQLKHVHMGYGSTYERDLILEIKRGLLIKESYIENT